MAAGTVATFDEHKGYGTVRDADDSRELFFHCTQIAGGTRTIAVGTDVTFDVVPGHLGRWEAIAVTPEEARTSEH
jgi:cold shock CspA family protein